MDNRCAVKIEIKCATTPDLVAIHKVFMDETPNVMQAAGDVKLIDTNGFDVNFDTDDTKKFTAISFWCRHSISKKAALFIMRRLKAVENVVYLRLTTKCYEECIYRDYKWTDGDMFISFRELTSDDIPSEYTDELWPLLETFKYRTEV